MRQSTAKTRMLVLGLLVPVLVAVFLMVMFQMQVVNGDVYKEKVNSSSSYTQSIAAARGIIVDRNGKVLVANKMIFNLKLNRLYLPNEDLNDTILWLATLLTENGEEYEDSLPVSKTAPYTYLEDREGDISYAKKTYKLNEYATAEQLMLKLVDNFGLEEYTPEQQRIIAGVRYEMVLKGYSNSLPFTFAADVSMETVVQVTENHLNYPGIDVSQDAVRTYPNGSIAPHILGYVANLSAEEYEEKKDEGYNITDVIGKSGVEKEFEEQLRGEDGEITVVRNKNGDIISETVTKTPVAGETVQLTIDARLQEGTLEILEKYIKQISETYPYGEGGDANAGAAVVIDVDTGEVLAAVSSPTYDLTDFLQNYSKIAADERNPLTNRAFTGLYTPGSVFKPCTSLAGLEAGVIDRATTVFCNHIYTYFSDYRPQCEGYHGNINLKYALAYSCNLYYYDVGRRTGIDGIVSMANQLGLGVKTGLEVPESTGIVSNPENRENKGGVWNPGDVIQASIGQGDTMVTPVQLATYTATIANKGTRYQTHLLKSITDSNGNVTQKTEPKVVAQVDTETSYFDDVEEGMVAVSREGSGRRGFLTYRYDIASKTGTPQVPTGSCNAVYISYGPVPDPEIAIAVVVEHGGSSVYLSPLVKEIYDLYFSLEIN